MGKTPRGPRGCGSKLLIPRMSGGSVEASSHQSVSDVGWPVLDKLLLPMTTAFRALTSSTGIA